MVCGDVEETYDSYSWSELNRLLDGYPIRGGHGEAIVRLAIGWCEVAIAVDVRGARLCSLHPRNVDSEKASDGTETQYNEDDD